MSKLKIEHGASRIKRTKLQSSIEQSIADDLALMAEWSENETNYVVNELLRFALTQDEEFQRYKAEHQVTTTSRNTNRNPIPSQIKSSTDPSTKPGAVSESASRHS